MLYKDAHSNVYFVRCRDDGAYDAVGPLTREHLAAHPAAPDRLRRLGRLIPTVSGHTGLQKFSRLLLQLQWVVERQSLTAAATVGIPDIPRDKDYPASAVQCHACGGLGCSACDNRGWFADPEHPGGRRCEWTACGKQLAPGHVAVYCSNACAAADA